VSVNRPFDYWSRCPQWLSSWAVVLILLAMAHVEFIASLLRAGEGGWL